MLLIELYPKKKQKINKIHELQKVSLSLSKVCLSSGTVDKNIIETLLINKSKNNHLRNYFHENYSNSQKN